MNDDQQSSNSDMNSSSDSSAKKSSMLPVVVIVVLLLVAGGYFLSKRPAPANNNETTAPVATDETSAVAPTGEVKEFTVNGANFKFDPAEITVKQGDTVKITFKSMDMMHDFVLDDFNARTDILKSGSEETVEFVADKAGTFEYFCSVADHRQKGMIGSLIVE
jgi:nitrite reductase (NO-forming)